MVSREAWIHGKQGAGCLLCSVWDSNPTLSTCLLTSAKWLYLSEPNVSAYAVGMTTVPVLHGPCEAQMLHIRIT